MGNSVFWYTPNDPGPTVEVDTGTTASVIQSKQVRDRASARGGNGSYSVFLGLRGERVTVAFRNRNFQNSAGRSLYDKLHNMLCWLKRGGLVGFSFDKDRAYASWASGAVGYGASSIPLSGNIFAGWSGASSLTSTRIVIESQKCIEQHAGSVSSNTLTLSSTTTVNDQTDFDALARYYLFWPCLRLPDDQLDQPILTNNQGLTFSFEAELETVPIFRGGSPDGRGLSLPQVRGTTGHSDGYTLEALANPGKTVGAGKYNRNFTVRS